LIILTLSIFRPNHFVEDGLEEAGMWEDSHYCWMVICKNRWYHIRQNLFYGHRIPLAETDVYASPPAINTSFTVRCDDCRKEYLYKPSEVVRHEQDLPKSFTPHPLFAQNFTTPTNRDEKRK
jgi:hypothetical protein